MREQIRGKWSLYVHLLIKFAWVADCLGCGEWLWECGLLLRRMIKLLCRRLRSKGLRYSKSAILRLAAICDSLFAATRKSTMKTAMPAVET